LLTTSKPRKAPDADQDLCVPVVYPTKPQERLLEQTVETCRMLYNDCLAERRDVYASTGRSVTKVEQLRHVKEIKAANPYAKGVHSHILQVAVADLDKAFRNFFRRLKTGEKPGYPRFKGRGRFDSFGLKEYGNGFKIDGRRLRISRRNPQHYESSGKPTAGTPALLA